MLDPLQFYCRILCNGMKTRFRMVMIAHPGPGIGFHKRFMWQIIIPPTPDHYILPHITQRIQAASAFQAGPHFISYPGAVPTLSRLHRSWMFPLSPAEQKELDDFLWENLANGCIRPSKSPMGAPVFFIKKKDGSLCLMQDYQKLNEIMVKNSYPLPLVSDVLTCLHDTEFFTVLDL